MKNPGLQLRGTTSPAAGPCPPRLAAQAVQPHLRYGVSALNGSYLTAPVAVDPAESLATAICCDKRTTPYAEPRFRATPPHNPPPLPRLDTEIILF